MSDKRKFLASPYILFILCGTIIPLLAVLYYALVDKDGNLTFANLASIADPVHRKALWLSLLLALICTVICLLLAFPLGLMLRRSGGKKGFIIFMLILPMWMNFLLRTIAWKILLQKNGFINVIFTSLGLGEIDILNTPSAVVLGLVYDFLPFMILPIYNVMVKIDNSLVEAAYDLGASPLYAFFKVELPILLPGIIAGGLLAFTLSIDDFVITFFVTGPGADTLPLKIYSMIKHSRQMPVINSLSTLMLVFTCVLVAASRFVANRRQRRPAGAKAPK